MNLSKSLGSASRFLYSLFLDCRRLLPRQRCAVFCATTDPTCIGIGAVRVINLDRETGRWIGMMRELNRIIDSSGTPISGRTIRYSACDALAMFSLEGLRDADIDPTYTLGDQLFVEPQPHASPGVFELSRRIEMSRSEVVTGPFSLVQI